jgi:hypothetical protein
MKNILIICLVFLLTTCNTTNTNVSPIGKWGDIIKFSTTELSFGVEGGTLSVTSEGKYWINGLFFNEKYITGYCHEDIKEYEGIKYLCDDFWGESYEKPELSQFEGEWFIITKTSFYQLVFTLKPNDTGKSRWLRLDVSAGDYFTSIKVNQEG